MHSGSCELKNPVPPAHAQVLRTMTAALAKAGSLHKMISQLQSSIITEITPEARARRLLLVQHLRQQCPGQGIAPSGTTKRTKGSIGRRCRPHTALARWGDGACFNERDQVPPAFFAALPTPEFAGPRRRGEGCDDDEQGIVSAEVTGGGTAKLRITLLAAGFVIGRHRRYSVLVYFQLYR